MIEYKTDLEFHYDVLELLARRLRPTLHVGLGIASANCVRRVAPYRGRAIGADSVEIMTRFPRRRVFR